MAESYLPNPSTTIIYFMLITLCFIFFTIYNILQTKSKESVADVAENNIINSIYILLLVVGSYFINATISKSMCSQSIQWSYILMITLLPWILIFISLYVILKAFPGWISPFSNTIGYVIIGFLGVEKIYDDIFLTGEEAYGNSELVKAIANMNSNKTKFINQISTNLDDFNNFFDNIIDALKPDVANKINNDRGRGGPIVNEGIPISQGVGIPISQGVVVPEHKPVAPTPEPKYIKIDETGFVGGVFESDTKKDFGDSNIEKRDNNSEIKDDYIDPLFKLYQLLVIKQVIGKVVWFILAGILISSVSYNLVISMACEKSLEEIQKDFETAREEAEQSSSTG